MKIAEIAPEKLPVPPVKGGACEMWIDEVNQILAKNNLVYVLSRPSGVKSENKIKYIPIKRGIREKIESKVRLPKIKKIARYLEIKKYAKKVAKKIPTDTEIIHIHNRPDIIPSVRKIHNKKIILHMHNDHLINNPILKNKYSKILSQTNLVLCVSNYIRDQVRKMYPEHKNKIQTLYNGVNTTNFKKRDKKTTDKVRKKYDLGKGKVILYVGRIVPEKGLHILVGAFKEYHKKYKDAKLVIAGSSWFKEGRLTPYIKELKESTKDLKSNIIFTGFIDGKEIQEMYSAADIFVCPSIWNEPFALVCLEALSSNVPTIATKTGGIQELVRGRGVLCERDNKDDLLNSLLEITKNYKKYQTKANNSRKYIEKNHTWKEITKQLEKHMRTLLK